MRSPEFPPNLRWFNSPPLKMRELKGRVVLIDFWTYSCVNCIRTLTHIKSWHEKYASAGLVVIGVHTPEFDFEKSPDNLLRAIKSFEIKYPVVLDGDYQIWSFYSNNVWPRKFLINADGQIVYDHSGEGNYRETEEAIQKELLAINPEVKLPPLNEDAEGTGGVCFPVTPEIYLGSLRGRPGKEWIVSEMWWKIHPEFIEHQRKTAEYEDYLTINFEASEVNLVMEAGWDRPAKIRVELNGRALKDMEVTEPKMYNLLDNRGLIKGEIKIFVKDEGFKAYAFTFGGCEKK